MLFSTQTVLGKRHSNEHLNLRMNEFGFFLKHYLAALIISLKAISVMFSALCVWNTLTIYWAIYEDSSRDGHLVQMT